MSGPTGHSCCCHMNKCSSLDQSDQELYSKDYGISGIAGPIDLDLTPTMQYGAVISVVTKATTRGTTNLFDEGNQCLLQVDARISWSGKNELLLNSYIDGGWRSDYRQLINPVASGAKVTTTIVYEPEGFRIFINGKYMAFYEHRVFKKPIKLNLLHDTIYKVTYLNTVKI